LTKIQDLFGKDYKTNKKKDKIQKICKVRYITDKIPKTEINSANTVKLNYLETQKNAKGHLKPGWIQIQAALYLGCNRISCFAYT
jgi:hypothetical protein